MINMLWYERKKSTIGDGHPDIKFANELGALHKYKISYILVYKKVHSKI